MCVGGGALAPLQQQCRPEGPGAKGIILGKSVFVCGLNGNVPSFHKGVFVSIPEAPPLFFCLRRAEISFMDPQPRKPLLVSSFCFSDGSLPGGPHGRPGKLEEVHYGTVTSNHFHPPWSINHSLTRHSLIYCLFNKCLLSMLSVPRAQLGSRKEMWPLRLTLPIKPPVSLPLFHFRPLSPCSHSPSDCPSHTSSSGLCQGFGVCCYSSLGSHRTGTFSSSSSKISHCLLREESHLPLEASLLPIHWIVFV